MAPGHSFVTVFVDVIARLYRALTGRGTDGASGTGDGQDSSGSSWDSFSDSDSGSDSGGDGGGD